MPPVTSPLMYLGKCPAMPWGPRAGGRETVPASTAGHGLHPLPQPRPSLCRKPRAMNRLIQAGQLTS